MRICFRKGKQREFFIEVLKSLGCPSLRELRNRGIEISYNTLKSYYSDRRLISEELFNSLCSISGLRSEDFSFKKLENNWGQIKGGKN